MKNFIAKFLVLLIISLFAIQNSLSYALAPNSKLGEIGHGLKNIRKYFVINYDVFFLDQERYRNNFFWKIHISASFNNYKKILEIVKPVLDKHKAKYKFLKDRESLLKFYSKKQENLGKYITIYPTSQEQALGLACDLCDIFKAKHEELGNIPENFTDRPIDDYGFVWARFESAGIGVVSIIGAHLKAETGNYRHVKYWNDQCDAILDEDVSDVFEKDFGRVVWNEEKQKFCKVLEAAA